jgi:hypothetical protein
MRLAGRFLLALLGGLLTGALSALVLGGVLYWAGALRSWLGG